MNVSEIFPSLQGEGPNAGQPMTFVRLQGCNLRCRWCDTQHSWFGAGRQMSQEEILQAVGTASWVCITGGEPLMQEAELGKLVKELAHKHVGVEIETNGTYACPKWSGCVDTWVVDTKCPSSGQVHKSDAAFNSWLGGPDFYHKFVVADEADLAVVSWLTAHPLMYNILVSPAFRADGTLDEVWGQKVWNYCVEHNYRFSLQTHKILWANKRKV